MGRRCRGAAVALVVIGAEMATMAASAFSTRGNSWW